MMEFLQQKCEGLKARLRGGEDAGALPAASARPAQGEVSTVVGPQLFGDAAAAQHGELGGAFAIP